jgi:hypothetical protein
VAAASYTTDLTLIHACDAASASWTEPTGFADGAITLPETDYFIQNTGCLSKNMGAGASAVSGAIYNAGAGLTIPSGSAVMMWLYFGAPNALATQANGGLRVFVGSGTAAFKHWYVKGSNTYVYGGWLCIPVDPNTTQDNTSGSPSTTLQYFGAAAVLSGAGAVSKGNPFGIDILRYGRCEARINGGDLANGYATFPGLATQNDAIANRWGLFQAVDGGYLMQGLLVLGYTSAVDFRDSNRNIQIANTEKVASTFNRIEIRNASSRVDWTNINIVALGTTARGTFEVIDNADLNIDACTFADMDTFVFLANSSVIKSTFRRTGLITPNGCSFTDNLIDSNRASIALTTTGANLSGLQRCTFISDGTGHGIEITGAAGTFSLVGHTFTGYAASNGSTGNEAIYVNIASGSVTLNVTSGGSTPTIRTAGATVTVNNNIAVTLTGMKDNTEVRVYATGTTTPELAGIEDATSGSANNRSFTFSLTGGTAIDIRIYAVGYQPADILNYTVPGSDTSIPIQQVSDRWYTNP